MLIVVPFDLAKCKNVEFAMDANTAALNLIQKWVGSDDKITDMSAFYDALVKALEDAHLEGEEEFSCRGHRRNGADTFLGQSRPTRSQPSTMSASGPFSGHVGRRMTQARSMKPRPRKTPGLLLAARRRLRPASFSFSLPTGIAAPTAVARG